MLNTVHIKLHDDRKMIFAFVIYLVYIYIYIYTSTSRNFTHSFEISSQKFQDETLLVNSINDIIIITLHYIYFQYSLELEQFEKLFRRKKPINEINNRRKTLSFQFFISIVPFFTLDFLQSNIPTKDHFKLYTKINLYSLDLGLDN